MSERRLRSGKILESEQSKKHTSEGESCKRKQVGEHGRRRRSTSRTKIHES